MAGIPASCIDGWKAAMLASVVAAAVFDHFYNRYVTFGAALCWASLLFVLRQSFLFASFGKRGIAPMLASRLGEWRGGRAYLFITSLFLLPP